MKRDQIGWHKVVGLALALMLTLFIAACGGAEEPAAAPLEEQASVVQEPAEEADDHSEDEAHDEEDDHEDEDGEAHDEDERREHGAHEHGAATLTIAWSGNEMEIELDTPAFNLFGFEYEPSTAEEIQLVEESLTDLESGALLVFNDEAGCRLDEADATTAWEDEDNHDEEDTDHAEDEMGETHSDVEARFTLTCESPDEIRTLDLGPMFDSFPNLEELDAQWVSDTTQSSAELTAGSSLLSLR